MSATAGWFTPMLPVAALERSIPFYERLGFELIDTDRCTPLGWARLHCRGGALMLLRAEGPVDAGAQSALFYLYTPDLPGLRDRLLAAGVPVGEIRRPAYAPAGEAFLDDPDGWRIGVMHWGESEHAAWQARSLLL